MAFNAGAYSPHVADVGANSVDHEGKNTFTAEAQRTQRKQFKGRNRKLFWLFSAALCVLCASAVNDSAFILCKRLVDATQVVLHCGHVPQLQRISHQRMANRHFEHARHGF